MLKADFPRKRCCEKDDKAGYSSENIKSTAIEALVPMAQWRATSIMSGVQYAMEKATLDEEGLYTFMLTHA